MAKRSAETDKDTATPTTMNKVFPSELDLETERSIKMGWKRRVLIRDG